MGKRGAIGALANLTKLSFEYSQISDPGMASFADAIARGGLPALQTMRLFGNLGSDAPVTKALSERKK